MIKAKYTDKILEMVEDGTLDKDAVILDLLKWMGEANAEQLYVNYYAPEYYDQGID